MSRIFDNIEQDLLGALRATLAVSKRADFCVGYLNLRGWQAVDDLVQPWSVETGQVCRVLVGIKLFLPYPLHAKLYLLFRDDVNNPITGFVGSSNLTMQGLARQGELNVDVLDHHATERLSSWFEARWDDRWALDVSAELAALIEAS